ncbi:hypothetical protein, partial [Serratia symbiotica]|uniref:hypothetical protein n=1 Tax=Serratia symbiotica TaxID=138074 RepID=UPI001E376EAC
CLDAAFFTQVITTMMCSVCSKGEQLGRGLARRLMKNFAIVKPALRQRLSGRRICQIDGLVS